jgi:hypothetical protein
VSDAPPPSGPPAPRPAYPESSQATLALVLGIVGLFVTIAAPFAWYFGAKEKNAIDAGRRDPANRGQALAGWILGVVVTVLAIIGLIVTIIIVVTGLGVAAGDY